MQIIDGDLFDFFVGGPMKERCDVIMHVCNCQGVMGSGIALSIRKKFPPAYEAYKGFHMRMGGSDIPLGSISHATINGDGKLIINLHAQRFYGGDGRRYLDYEALYKCLVTASVLVFAEGHTRIGVPYLMGCDRAGGDWKIVDAMCESVFADKIFAAKL